MTAAEGERQLVVFPLHGEHYGMPITTVREIIHTSRRAPPRPPAVSSRE